MSENSLSQSHLDLPDWDSLYCAKCCTFKHFTEFPYRPKRMTREKTCKTCSYARTEEWRNQNREYTRQYARQWRTDNIEKARENDRKKQKDPIKERERARRRMGIFISEEEYQVMFNEQNGICLLCQQPSHNGPLVVDHSHKTGEIRGLLCNYCNWVLHDAFDAAWHRRAADYLERFE